MQADPQNVRRTIHIFYAKNPSHLTRFEHFAAVDRPQPLYDRFTGKLAPSTLLLVNVLTEKDVDHVFAKKNQRKHRNYTSTMNNVLVSLSSSCSPYLFLSHSNAMRTFKLVSIMALIVYACYGK